MHLCEDIVQKRKMEYLLHTACRELLFLSISDLLRVGYDINAFNELGETPLTCLITNSYKAPEVAAYCVSILLFAGADPNIHQEGSFTPLMLAVIYQNGAIQKLLLEYQADPNILYKPLFPALIPYGSSALSIAFLLRNDISLLLPLVNTLHDPYVFSDAFLNCDYATHQLLANSFYRNSGIVF